MTTKENTLRVVCMGCGYVDRFASYVVRNPEALTHPICNQCDTNSFNIEDPELLKEWNIFQVRRDDATRSRRT